MDGRVPGDCRQRTPWQAVASALVAESGVRVGEGQSYGPDPRHRFDIYEPEAGTDSIRSTAVFIYGGGWKSGERGCYRFVGAALARRGIRTLIPDYRVYPDVRYPDFVDDVALAYRHIVERFDLGYGPAIVGHSAGAHIGALISGNDGTGARLGHGIPGPAAFVGLSGPYVFDPTTWDTTHEIFAPAAGNPDQARPIAQAGPRFPRALLIHGGRDHLVTPNASRLFHDKLQEHGVQSELRIYRLLAHAGPILALARPLRWTAPVLSDIVSFVTKA